MHNAIVKRVADWINKPDIAPQLTALMIASGLLVIWAGLCAI